MGQGANTPSYTLAQTFRPLIHMALGLQVFALQGGGTAAPADQIVSPARGTELYQQPPVSIVEAKFGKDAAEEYVPKGTAGKKRKGDADGEEPVQRQQHKASNNNRESRRRKTSLRFSDYVSIDDM